MKQQIYNAFTKRYRAEPELYKSPGRINLIGEHTDYNDGFVLPAAVDKAIYFAVKPNATKSYRFYAYDYDEAFQTDEIKPSTCGWANYLLGVVAQFIADGKAIGGFDCVFGGDIPIGAGMSSSAAIECGLSYALNDIYKLQYEKLQLVKFAQKAEHEYAHVQCGIMDQFAVMYGKAGQAIKLDCRSLDYAYFPVKIPAYQFILVNTGVKHALASSAYNQRREECEAGVLFLQQFDPGIKSLRDVPFEMLNKYKQQLDPIIFRRCSYVIQENIRLEAACLALEKGKLKYFGKLMYASHYGLRDDFEVSCGELDQLVHIAETHPDVIGSRMMGGGFGGCTINLVKESGVSGFEEAVRMNYRTPDAGDADIIKVNIGEGTNKVEI